MVDLESGHTQFFPLLPLGWTFGEAPGLVARLCIETFGCSWIWNMGCAPETIAGCSWIGCIPPTEAIESCGEASTVPASGCWGREDKRIGEAWAGWGERIGGPGVDGAPARGEGGGRWGAGDLA